MSSNPIIDYHLRELAIARDPTNTRHAMPAFSEADQAILDIGCGIGQTLVAQPLPGARDLVGLDIDEDSLRYGREHFPQVNFVHGRAEALPFEAQRFDLVISRVALPYTHIPRALAEVHRVLKPGGRVWFTLHRLSRTRGELWSSLRQGAVKDVIHRSYVLANGLLLHSTGQMLPFPRPGQYESFQTLAGMRRCLQRQGFEQIDLHSAPHFVCTARKPG